MCSKHLLINAFMYSQLLVHVLSHVIIHLIRTHTCTHVCTHVCSHRWSHTFTHTCTHACSKRIYSLDSASRSEWLPLCWLREGALAAWFCWLTKSRLQATTTSRCPQLTYQGILFHLRTPQLRLQIHPTCRRCRPGRRWLLKGFLPSLPLPDVIDAYACNIYIKTARCRIVLQTTNVSNSCDRADACSLRWEGVREA